MASATSRLRRRSVPVELSDDERIARRVRRLGIVSLVALGLMLGMAIRTLEAPGWVEATLAVGWALMPLVLFSSLGRPRLRYLLVLPASLVSIGLLAICVAYLPAAALAATGWWLMTAGVLLGDGQGLWFWYRIVPVPAALDDPYSAGRRALIGVHVALIVGGWVLAATAAFSGQL
jgi:hypothetical protein